MHSESGMNENLINIGIDTGGTYTDAVLVSGNTGEVLSVSKVLTSHHNLAIGIENAITAVLQEWNRRKGRAAFSVDNVGFVGLSTTWQRMH